MSDDLDVVESAPAEKSGKSVMADPMIMSTVGLIGDINEDTSNEVTFSLLMLHEKKTTDYLSMILGMDKEALDELSEEDIESLKPNIDFYISTNGWDV